MSIDLTGMEPGKKMDILIAHLVFGVEPNDPDNDLCMFIGEGIGCPFMGRCKFSEHDSWAVVDHLTAIGHSFSLNKKDGGWKAVFSDSAGTADTIPMAICLAAIGLFTKPVATDFGTHISASADMDTFIKIINDLKENNGVNWITVRGIS